MAATHLQNLPEDGLSGKWNFSVSPKGYIVRSLFVDVLKYLNTYVEQEKIKKPVVLIMDGASPHLSLEKAAYCKESQIQPWLLRPNMTHLTQPLDLFFFADLKFFAWKWQTDPKNTGQVLTKYSVILLLKEVTEHCLAKPSLTQNGFKKAGLFPWNKAAPDRSKLLPSTVFANSSEPASEPATESASEPAIYPANEPASEHVNINILPSGSTIESPPEETEVIPMFDMDIFTDSLEPFVESSYQPLLEPSLNHELADQSTSVLVSAMDSELENPGLDEITFDLSFQPTSNSTFNHGHTPE